MLNASSATWNANWQKEAAGLGTNYVKNTDTMKVFLTKGGITNY